MAAATTDCWLGLDEGALSCALLCSTFGACGVLECNIDPVTGKGDLTSAHCPAHAPADMSCCN
jgi:hypothetical protein